MQKNLSITKYEAKLYFTIDGIFIQASRGHDEDLWRSDVNLLE